MPLLSAVVAAQHVGTSLLGIIRRIRVRIVPAVASGADCAVQAPRARRQQPPRPMQEEEAALTKAAAARPAPVDGAASEPARHAVLFEQLRVNSTHLTLVPMGARVAQHVPPKLGVWKRRFTKLVAAHETAGATQSSPGSAITSMGRVVGGEGRG